MKKMISVLALVILCACVSYASKLISVPDGFVYVAGVNSENCKGDLKDVKLQGDDDALIVKYDRKREFVKASSFGEKSAYANFADVLYSDGYYYAVGGINHNYSEKLGINYGTDVLIVKYDKDLNPVKSYVWKQKGDEYPEHIIVLKNGNFAVCGNSYSSNDKTLGMVFVFDSELKILANRFFIGSFSKPNDAPITDFACLTDNMAGNIVVAGYTSNNDPQNLSVKACMYELSSKLDTVRKAAFGGKNNEIYFKDIMETSAMEYILVGHKSGSVCKGVVMETDMEFKKKSFMEYLPDFAGKTYFFNSFDTVRPSIIGGYMITGCLWGNDSFQYYVNYRTAGGFEDLTPFPPLERLNYTVDDDTAFTVIGYDKENNLVCRENGWG
ncbi:MAG: hypothetical protein KBT47_06555 [Armatimonadetes bacterium]|nr:hypothetical protein [Candidatus Hippobium faecium]